MYHYIVGYDSYEESPEIVLVHEFLFSKEEFQKICSEVTAVIYKNRKTLFKDQYDKLSTGAMEIDYDPKSSFQDLYKDVVNELIKTHDFKTLEIHSVFKPFGWAKLIPEDSWGNETSNDADLKSIRDLL